MKDRYQYLMQQKKKKKRRRITLLLIILLLFGGGGYYVYSSFSSLLDIYSGTKTKQSKLREEEVEITKKPFTVLLMGVEDYSSGGHNGRTDSLIVAAVNPKTQRVTMMSIPRDSYVSIPGRTKKDKINAAYAYGGEQLTIDTVEQLLRIPIDHYTKIDFNGFKQIVDAVGGVTVDVPFDFVEGSDLNPRKGITFKKGKQHLNGEEALAYARMRKHDPRGDFGRADRQRQLLSAIFEKVSSPSSLLKVNDLAKAVGKNIKTDIPVSDGLALYRKFSKFNAQSIETLKLEGEDATINSIYYYQLDEESVDTAHDTFMDILELVPKEDLTEDTTDNTNEESTQ
ncbi:LCP family protein [Ectobacillus antri]|jgi:LCP family protein required for cell wall assembly|uniref:LCP family protein n=1 Tax=Ectobacillus antri TaxID=2486280 RepID=A0ABT6H8L0_9BACI|nr:LCP family protein [Ectobacillus antri]MDG4657185.1 LCP family protein [Ectobacillus antri]MDG5755198.1 LCP family protein [Ectobacillus antri]